MNSLKARLCRRSQDPRGTWGVCDCERVDQLSVVRFQSPRAQQAVTLATHQHGDQPGGLQRTHVDSGALLASCETKRLSALIAPS
jgi:hypothetical protein